jgi:glycosyltransferase involved in cell wall biosynthesis
VVPSLPRFFLAVLRTPAFSIITPTYGAAEFVKRCHWSLARQTIEDWEWVIVDDASQDGTRDIVQELRDPRIRYHRFPENQGRGPARNHALQSARGEWSVILDMDDLCFPDRLEVAASTKADGDEFLCSALVLVDHDYRVKGVRGVGGDGYPRSFPHATLCGPSKVLAEIGYPAYRRAQDQTMVLTMANTRRGRYCEEPLYVYHENASVGLRDAFTGHYYSSRQFGELVRSGVLRPTWDVRRAQLRHVLKLAGLMPLFLCPSLYGRTLGLRSKLPAGESALGPERTRFLAECARLFPMTASP